MGLTFRDVLGKEFTVYDVSSSGSISKYENVTIEKVKIKHMCSPTLVKGRIKFSDEVDHVTEEYVLRNGPLMSFDVKDINIGVAGLNKNGNISIGLGHAAFLNRDEAQALARRIVTTKYENLMKKIDNI
jgi:hypothetical protein